MPSTIREKKLRCKEVRVFRYDISEKAINNLTGTAGEKSPGDCATRGVTISDDC